MSVSVSMHHSHSVGTIVTAPTAPADCSGDLRGGAFPEGCHRGGPTGDGMGWDGVALERGAEPSRSHVGLRASLGIL